MPSFDLTEELDPADAAMRSSAYAEPERPSNVYAFKTGAGVTQATEVCDQRYLQRAADKLTKSFYKACRLGHLDVAR